MAVDYRPGACLCLAVQFGEAVIYTPKFVTASILDLCAQIRPGAKPLFIRVTPGPGCDVSNCFWNVKRKVDVEGGRIQYGWAIWETPHIFVEAEHHCVYESPGGRPLRDITPQVHPENDRVLFLPDDSAVYEFENEGVRRDNFRLAIVEDPLIEAFFRLAEEKNAILNEIPGIGMVTLEGDTAVRFQRNEEEFAQLELYLKMKYTPQGAPCFCGSNQKFKRCHGSSRPRLPR